MASLRPFHACDSVASWDSAGATSETTLIEVLEIILGMVDDNGGDFIVEQMDAQLEKNDGDFIIDDGG